MFENLKIENAFAGSLFILSFYFVLVINGGILCVLGYGVIKINNC